MFNVATGERTNWDSFVNPAKAWRIEELSKRKHIRERERERENLMHNL